MSGVADEIVEQNVVDEKEILKELLKKIGYDGENMSSLLPGKEECMGLLQKYIETEANEKVATENEDYKMTKKKLENLEAKNITSLIKPIAGKQNSKVLYLTTQQAREVSQDESLVKAMMENFCGDNNNPDLIINLIQSWGFYSSTTLMTEQFFADKSKYMKFKAGLEHKTGPFRSDREEMETMARIEEFMVRVIIPLAQKTNAIIICNGVQEDCVLTEAFINVLDRKSAKWSKYGKLPFTIVKFLNQTRILYMKDDKCLDEKKFVWQEIMESSQNWKAAHSSHLEKYFKAEKAKQIEKDEKRERRWWRGHDLDRVQGNLIIVDDIDFPEKRKNKEPQALFLRAIMNFYGRNIQSLIVKTGATVRSRAEKIPNSVDRLSMTILVDHVNAGDDVICLDVRKHGEVDKYHEHSYENFEIKKELENKLQGCYKDENYKNYITERIKRALKIDEKDYSKDDSSRDSLEEEGVFINSAKGNNSIDKASVENETASLKTEVRDCTDTTTDKENGHIEILDCCALSYIHSEINKWKLIKRRNNGNNGECLGTKPVVLVDLIRKNEREQQIINSSTDIAQNVDLIYTSCQFAEEFFKMLLIPEKQDDSNESYFKEEIGDKQKKVLELLQSNKFHGLNVWTDFPTINKYIEKKIIFNARRPGENPPLEGLHLLEKAWGFWKAVNKDAENFKIMSRLMFLIELLLGIAITILSIGAADWSGFDKDKQFVLQKCVFGITLLLSALLTLESLIAPKRKWRQLRVASVQIESLVWKYRMCIGDFEPDIIQSTGPEKKLRVAFEEWRNELQKAIQNVSGTRIPHTPATLSENTRAQLDDGSHTKPLQVKNTKGKGGNDATEKEDTQWDDHYTFLDTDKYIALRVQPLIKRYQTYVPKSPWMQHIYQIFGILIGIAIAFVSQIDFNSDVYGSNEDEIDPVRFSLSSDIVIILVAVSAAIKSWSEFDNVLDNSQIYPIAISECKSKLIEWKSTERFRRTNRERTINLVEGVESVALRVVETWARTLLEIKRPNANEPEGNRIINMSPNAAELA